MNFDHKLIKMITDYILIGMLTVRQKCRLLYVDKKLYMVII